MQSWVSGTDFQNDQFVSESVTIAESSYTFPTDMQIRFTCDASYNSDDVYIDEIRITASTGGAGAQSAGGSLIRLVETQNPAMPSTHAALGTPHAWLEGQGLIADGTTYDEAERANPDGDAFTTAQEYIGDTDPTDAGSYPCITGASLGPYFEIRFDSSTGRVYTLIGSSDLVDDTWTKVPGAGPRLGCGGEDVLRGTNQPPWGPFYRLQINLP
ncbi:MAG: hypothetical protein HQ523_13150 [Lentisphaerae bacterium]|nr:hypothetical protein [Lentisphaerota bacterium]